MSTRKRRSYLMGTMTATKRERRKREIAHAIERKKLRDEMRIGLAFDTDEGRKAQEKIGRFLG